MRTGHALFAKEQNRGTNGSPGSPENSIIKGGDGCEESSEKKREKNTRKKKFSRKNSQKICAERKILREKQVLLPGIL